MPLTKHECRAAAETAALYPPGFGNDYFAITSTDIKDWLWKQGAADRTDPFGEPRIAREWLKARPEDMGNG